MSGIIGMIDRTEDIARPLVYGMYALQHRGQRKTGLGILNGKDFYLEGDGMIKDVVHQEEVFQVPGRRGIGHVRYGKYEGYSESDIPFPYYDEARHCFVTFDGNILNEDFEITDFIEIFQKSDEEIAAYLSTLRGAFTILYLDREKLVAVRDRWGLKPLFVSSERSHVIVASESCALDSLSVFAKREVNPGEVLICENGSVRSFYYGEPQHRTCAFEYVYVARPDSYMMNKSIYKLRNNLGKTLYEELPTDADIVIGAPDSGLTAATGYAEASGLPYKDGIIKNRYIGRTFINPKDAQRVKDVHIKLNPIREVLEGQRVILVDDSIVKGITIRRTVDMLKKAGAKEVHVRITAPPVVNYCNLSLDMPEGSQLIAREHSVEEIREMIGADSLYFISLEGLKKNLVNVGICTHCFDGSYPIKEE